MLGWFKGALFLVKFKEEGLVLGILLIAFKELLNNKFNIKRVVFFMFYFFFDFV